MYSALTIAKYIIDYCNEAGYGISNLKLQKILYFVQAQFLVAKENNTPCFSDAIEAWDFGPVVPSVYHRYKIYGNGIIPSRTSHMHNSEQIHDDDLRMINLIVDKVKGHSASSLVELTHKQTPWINAYVRGRNNPISNDIIREFFGKK